MSEIICARGHENGKSEVSDGVDRPRHIYKGLQTNRRWRVPPDPNVFILVHKIPCSVLGQSNPSPGPPQKWSRCPYLSNSRTGGAAMRHLRTRRCK